MDSETRKLLEEYGLTAYAIERQSGYVTEQAIVALVEQTRREALENDSAQRSQRLDELGEGLARILTRLDDYQGVIRDARAKARREAMEEACRAICYFCQRGASAYQPDQNGSYWHTIPGTGLSTCCEATSIRILIEQAPQTPT